MAAVTRVNGPLVEVDRLGGAAMYDLVRIGGLPGEIVALRGERATVQMYEYTGGLRPGLEVEATGAPLSAPLGPHLLGGVFDGLLRPLDRAPAWLDPRSRPGAGPGAWRFTPLVAAGRPVAPGTPVGSVAAAGRVPYLVLAPGGVVGDVRPEGEYPATATVATVGGTAVTMTRRWPVRRALPCRERLAEPVPLVTGQRVLDLLLPVRRGGAAAVPGGFGTGKTVLLQQIARWCDADVVVYVGCGERGNELADVLAGLAGITDPRTGGRLADRTVVVANTSNMPMMAREASVYTGMTVAEHFRDMGYDVVLIADSTSRWAEARREFAARAGEPPAEEGHPADLASAIAAFYERAGRVTTLGGRTGSVTVLGAVSPPGGDLTEPVTAHTERFVRTLWTLDRDLAYARHYPAVSVEASFSRDGGALSAWHDREGRPGWAAAGARVAALLAEAGRLAGTAELVGASALPDRERVVLLGGRLLREGLLRQSALSPADAYCSPGRTLALAGTVLAAIDDCLALAATGVPAEDIESRDFTAVLRAKETG
ncbi:V-type ATP synthase alpha chain [Sphaerisporangium rufum]|uniref:V-type ATP synthase alpha chain n=1 Tax=Sphaerisporangium rufum TaxID=1381558 RepID=A0A919R014_9ACTN|nr:V-type ATP synthase subunit A [Sphaerisporangium rufum]GII75916.1 V-type ATP synthase alpha chain [Sphaerisporangium rufum]